MFSERDFKGCAEMFFLLCFLGLIGAGFCIWKLVEFIMWLYTHWSVNYVP